MKQKFTAYVAGKGWSEMESETELGLELSLIKANPGQQVIVRPLSAIPTTTKQQEPKS